MTDPNLYLRSQYLIASDTNGLGGLAAIPFGEKIPWNGLTVLADKALPVLRASSEKVDILVLGLLLHHEHPEFSNEDIVASIAAKSASVDDALSLFQDCGGRYVALLHDESRTVAMTDPCAMRRLYWYGSDSQLILSSSPRLILDALGRQPNLDGRVAALVQNQQFIGLEQPWVGDTWYDSSIKKIIANHCLDLKALKVRRMNYVYNGPSSREEIIPYAAGILRGLIRSAHSRYRLLQPLTAGYDSRLLLAASRPLRKDIQYYLFASTHDLSRSSDILIATRLAKRLGLNLQVILPGTLREAFSTHLKKKCYFPRILPKAAQIQWHYDTHGNSRVININGNCAEISRHYKRSANYSVENLNRHVGFNGFFAQYIRTWYDEAVDYCGKTGINIFDLFYWEQRMSNWGAHFPFEQDVAIEEFTPYNHKNLIHALLKVDLHTRRAPRFQLFRDLTDHLWPETLSEPFNPVVGWSITSRFKRMITGG